MTSWGKAANNLQEWRDVPLRYRQSRQCAPGIHAPGIQPRYGIVSLGADQETLRLAGERHRQ